MRTWAEIDLDALKFNFDNIRRSLKPNVKVMSVIKADAYGHGVIECAKTLLACGTDAFAVATASEALELRQAGFDTPTLILGAVASEDFKSLIENDITLGISDTKSAEALSETAKKVGKRVKIHIKADTGMSRLGFVAGGRDTVGEILKISKLPNIEIEGIFSHFACADEEDAEYTKMQFKRFCDLTNALEAEGLKIPIKHIANSAAIIMYPETHLDMVRPGIILYGYYPSDEVDKKKISLKPVMSVKSRVTLVKEAEAGVGVSYGKVYITEGKTKIATVPIGYADGYPRALLGKAKMEARGGLAPVIGRICMDQCMIDVTNVHNIEIGDEVTVFGNGKITADDMAKWLGSISYEVLCLVAMRVPRVYTEGGRIIKKVDYLEGV